MDQKKKLLPIILNIILIHLSQYSAENVELITPSNAICACVGETLNYTCTVAVDAGSATGSTLWRGSTFMCAGDEIPLIHARFMDASGECNDGDIVARSVGVEGMRYTSELEVRISTELNGKSINCSWDLRPQEKSSMIAVAAACGDVRPVIDLTEADVSPGELTFHWSQLDSGCSTVQYRITSDCGSCPRSVIDETLATCSDLQLSETERNCTFSIMSMTRGFNGTPSSPYTVTLKVPGPPRAIFIPVYSSSTRALIRFNAEINQMDSFSISEGISGYTLNYTFHFSSSADLMTVANCMKSVCVYMIQIPTTECQSMGDISTIRVSASNMLGPGPSSDPVFHECMNEFVTVETDSVASTLSCLFKNNQSNSANVCRVEYTPCNQEETFTSEGNSTLDFPNKVTLQIDLPSGSDCYTYIVRASDGTSMVIVDGTVAPAGRRNSSTSTETIIVAVIVPFVIILLAIAVTVIVVLLFKFKRKSNKKKNTHELYVSKVGATLQSDAADAASDQDTHNIMSPKQYAYIDQTAV